MRRCVSDGERSSNMNVKLRAGMGMMLGDKHTRRDPIIMVYQSCGAQSCGAQPGIILHMLAWSAPYEVWCSRLTKYQLAFNIKLE